MIGETLGPYEIISKLGAGGMGEVYRARDTRLHRDVAIKVLPPGMAGDADRLARFRREAQVLASLNHPNIAAIHGLEERGAIQALVMELVPGRTLDELLGPPMPPTEVLAIARQVASALEAAHEQGIVHRDLKPSNVKVADDGTVKVLDFGLAKALGPDAAAKATPSASGAPYESPTMTSPAMTEIGVILGTAGYMSPEQAKGKAVDRRADIWALGVVMFELLTGRTMYRGETVTETIAHVITQAPPWDNLPASTPPALRRLLRRMLEKDIRNRLQSAGDVRIEIDELLASGGGPAESTIVAPPPLWRRMLPWAIASLSLAVAAIALWPKTRPPAELVRFDARLTDGARLIIDQSIDSAVATISPDGRMIAYVAEQSAERALYVRSLGADASTRLAGPGFVYGQFFSPDSRHVAFFTADGLHRVSVEGGAPQRIAAAADARGGAWGPDGTIVFTPDTETALMRVNALGGAPAPLTTLGASERTHRWPSFLPDGKTVVFISQKKDGSYDDASIESVRLDTGERKVLVSGGTFPMFVEPGYLLYTRADTVFGVRFNPKTLEVQGEAKAVATEVMSSSGGTGADASNGASQFSIASNGTAVYVRGRESTDMLLRLVFTDRAGRVVSEHHEAGIFRDPRFSPDGKSLALRVQGNNRVQIHVLDVARDTLRQLTFGVWAAGQPVWTNDGKRLAYYVNEPNNIRIEMRSVDGTGEPETLVTAPGILLPTSFLPGDRALLVSRITNPTDVGIETLSLADKTAKPFIPSPALEFLGQISPDGKWIVYQLGLTEAANVFVRAYPDGGGLTQVSTPSGAIPMWTKNGREIVYAKSDGDSTTFLAVDVSASSAGLTLGKPVELFKFPLATVWSALPYDVSPDGSRFALLRLGTDAAARRTNVMVVLNFTQEIERALSAAR